jgi:hypothetical protein
VFIFIQAPDGTGMYKDKVNVNSYEMHEKKLMLNEVGDYEIRMTNNFQEYKILSISMMLQNCHTMPHKIEKKDINLFVKKMGKAGQSQVDGLMGIIKAKDNSYNHFIDKMKKMTSQMKKSVAVECLIFITLTLIQVVAMKKLLDDNQII